LAGVFKDNGQALNIYRYILEENVSNSENGFLNEGTTSKSQVLCLVELTAHTLSVE